MKRKKAHGKSGKREKADRESIDSWMRGWIRILRGVVSPYRVRASWTWI
jgi:hypothetical protein